MSRSFATLKPNLFQSDYITRKDAKIMYCNKTSNLILNVNSSSQYDLYKKGKYLYNRKCRKYLLDETHLDFGLYKKKDCTDICSVIEGPPCTNYTCPQCLEPVPVTVLGNLDKPFYLTNTVLSTSTGCP